MQGKGNKKIQLLLVNFRMMQQQDDNLHPNMQICIFRMPARGCLPLIGRAEGWWGKGSSRV